jgi:hypothetical protein
MSAFRACGVADVIEFPLFERYCRSLLLRVGPIAIVIVAIVIVVISAGRSDHSRFDRQLEESGSSLPRRRKDHFR